MSISVLSKRKRIPQDVLSIDLTKNGTDPTFVRFSPFYPHGGIPVPGFASLKTVSVEGAWQGLKTFELEGPDFSFLNKQQPKKRGVSKARGKVRGHRYGEGADAKLLDYVASRKALYVPMYHYVLQTYLVNEVELLKGLVKEGNHVVLLDYDVNEDIEDTRTPLSHASLVKEWVVASLVEGGVRV